MVKIGITFAVFNKIKHTMRCLESIYNNRSKNELYVVVVDNASEDKSSEIIKKKYPNVKIISNKANMGCAYAWNQGLNDCLENNCDYLILTQNDVLISKRTIDKCYNFLEENKEIMVTSPFTINVPHNSDFSINQSELNKLYKHLSRQYKNCKMFSFCFYFFMMRREVFKKVQFDETFRKAQFEDFDFYNNIKMNLFVTCYSLDCGIAYHRFGTTQVIAKNSDPGGNKRYYNKKWKKKEKKLIENKNKIKGMIKLDNSCPMSGSFIDIYHPDINKVIKKLQR